MTRHKAADVCAALAAAAVLVIGLITVIGDSNVLAPESTTTVTKGAVAKTAGTTKTTKTTTSNPGAGDATTTTVESTGWPAG